MKTMPINQDNPPLIIYYYLLLLLSIIMYFLEHRFRTSTGVFNFGEH